MSDRRLRALRDDLSRNGIADAGGE